LNSTGKSWAEINLPAKYYKLRDSSPDKGQAWRGEDLEERISLCEAQTIEPIISAHASGKILEAGCGLGRWVLYLKSKGCDITGIDIARDGLVRITSHEPEAKVVAGNIESLPFNDNTFDTVISLGVVEHLEHGTEKALSEFRRVLKPGGALLLAVPYQNIVRTLMIRPLRWLYKKIIARGSRPFSEYRYIRREVVRMIAKAGFSVERIEADDFRPPYNMGMYVDWPMLRSRRKWRLNWFGKLVRLPWRMISKWSITSGVLVIGRKSTGCKSQV
jgi:SAM-dependent methyltransferase